MSTMLTIAKREFRANFDSPLAYILICGGLIMLGLVFFFYGGGFWQADRASMQALFNRTPLGLVILVPVITMRVLAEEKRSGTLEMLITLPVRDHEIILGKFFGALGLVLLFIAATALYPIMMFRFPWHLGALDSGPVISGYVGLILYTAAAVSVGLLISSLTESQVIAFFVSFIVLFCLHYVAGWIAESGGQSMIRNVAAFVSFETRLAPFTRGMINTRDVLYFLSITVGCLMVAFRALERRKWA